MAGEAAGRWALGSLARGQVGGFGGIAQTRN